MIITINHHMELTEEKINSYFIHENAIIDMKNSSMTTLE